MFQQRFTYIPQKTEISISELKAHCSRVIDDVARGRGEVVVTRRGRPVAKLVPVGNEERPRLFGFAKGMIAIHGDVVASVEEPWNVER